MNFALQKSMNSSAKSMNSSSKSMNSSTKIYEFIYKNLWIHLLNEFIHLQNQWIHLQKSMNSSIIIYEFISKMNSLVNEFINFEKNIKNLLQDSNHVPNISTHSAQPPTACWTHPFFYNIYTAFTYDSHEWENDVTNYYRWIHCKTKIAYRWIQKRDN